MDASIQKLASASRCFDRPALHVLVANVGTAGVGKREDARYTTASAKPGNRPASVLLIESLDTIDPASVHRKHRQARTNAFNHVGPVLAESEMTAKRLMVGFRLCQQPCRFDRVLALEHAPYVGRALQPCAAASLFTPLKTKKGLAFRGVPGDERLRVVIGRVDEIGLPALDESARVPAILSSLRVLLRFTSSGTPVLGVDIAERLFEAGELSVVQRHGDSKLMNVQMQVRIRLHAPKRQQQRRAAPSRLRRDRARER